MIDISPLKRKALDALPTKAARIRALGGEGFRQADIARFLGVSDQHVSHVLIRSMKAGIASEILAPATGGRSPAHGGALVPDVDGRIALPPDLLAALNLRPGEGFLASIEGLTLRLVPAGTALDRARDLVRAFDTGSGSPVDELIAERRREAME